MKKVLSSTNQWLAGLIFILWSIGIIVLPLMENGRSPLAPQPPLLKSVLQLYGALHIIIFAYTLYLIYRFSKHFFRHRTLLIYGQAALYLYILIALAISFYSLVQ